MHLLTSYLQQRTKWRESGGLYGISVLNSL